MRGVPFNWINAVNDPVEVVMPHAKNAVETEPLLRSENFACVGWADGVEHVSVQQTCLEKVQFSIELEFVRNKKFPAESCVGHGTRVEDALISQIVKRQKGRGLFELSMLPVDRLEVQRDHAGLPVIAVDDVRRHA